jgi:hypothetical protein
MADLSSVGLALLMVAEPLVVVDYGRMRSAGRGGASSQHAIRLGNVRATCPAATSRAAILRRLNLIAERIQPLGARVVNTVYDPSDGDNNVGRRELGLSRLAMIELRRRLNAVNRGIGTLALVTNDAIRLRR